MSDLTTFRDYARRMAAGQPLRGTAASEHQQRNQGRAQVGLPPLPAPDEVSEADRVLWGRLAAEVDTYNGT